MRTAGIIYVPVATLRAFGQKSGETHLGNPRMKTFRCGHPKTAENSRPTGRKQPDGRYKYFQCLYCNNLHVSIYRFMWRYGRMEILGMSLTDAKRAEYKRPELFEAARRRARYKWRHKNPYNYALSLFYSRASERKKADERDNLLLKELQHESKN